MAIVGLCAVAFELEVEGLWLLITAVGFWLLCLGTCCLGSLLAYGLAALARHGIQRDIRRAGLAAINAALAERQSRIDLADLSEMLLQTFKPAYGALIRDDIDKELDGLCLDLEIEPALDDAEVSPSKWDLAPLLTRLRQLPTVSVSADGSCQKDDSDEVIFDTEMSHERIRLLA